MEQSETQWSDRLEQRTNIPARCLTIVIKYKHRDTDVPGYINQTRPNTDTNTKKTKMGVGDIAMTTIIHEHHSQRKINK